MYQQQNYEFYSTNKSKKGTWGENTLVIALGCVCSCYCIYLYLSSTITYLTTLLSLLFMFKSILLKSKIELFTVDYFTKKARFPWSEDCCNLPFCAPAWKPFFAEEASTVETRPTPTDPLAFGGGRSCCEPACDRNLWPRKLDAGKFPLESTSTSAVFSSFVSSVFSF